MSRKTNFDEQIETNQVRSRRSYRRIDVRATLAAAAAVTSDVTDISIVTDPNRCTRTGSCLSLNGPATPLPRSLRVDPFSRTARKKFEFLLFVIARRLFDHFLLAQYRVRTLFAYRI